MKSLKTWPMPEMLRLVVVDTTPIIALALVSRDWTCCVSSTDKWWRTRLSLVGEQSLLRVDPAPLAGGAVSTAEQLRRNKSPTRLNW